MALALPWRHCNSISNAKSHFASNCFIAQQAVVLCCWLCSFLTRRLLTGSVYSTPHSPSCPVYFCALSNMFEFSNDYNCIGPVTDRGTTTGSPGIWPGFSFFLACVFHVAAFWDLFQLVVYCVCVVVLRPKTDLSDCVVRVNNLPQLQSHHITSQTPLQVLPLCLKLSINCSEKLRIRSKYYR